MVPGCAEPTGSCCAGSSRQAQPARRDGKRSTGSVRRERRQRAADVRGVARIALFCADWTTPPLTDTPVAKLVIVLPSSTTVPPAAPMTPVVAAVPGPASVVLRTVSETLLEPKPPPWTAIQWWGRRWNPGSTVARPSGVAQDDARTVVPVNTLRLTVPLIAAPYRSSPASSRSKNVPSTENSDPLAVADLRSPVLPISRTIESLTDSLVGPSIRMP